MCVCVCVCVYGCGWVCGVAQLVVLRSVQSFRCEIIVSSHASLGWERVQPKHAGLLGLSPRLAHALSVLGNHRVHLLKVLSNFSEAEN
jgi:hypothetical protein